MEIEALKKKLRSKAPAIKEHVGKLSSGLTVINKACSGKATWAFKAGCYAMLVGGSRAGKTWMLKTVMAEACRNPDFDDYDLYEDKPERGDLMDVKKYFGEEVLKRVKPPTPEGPSKTLEGFYDNVMEIVDRNRKFILGLDSEDALPPMADIKRARHNKGARKKIASGDEKAKEKGTMGAEKAKTNSTEMRHAHRGLDNGSMLFILKQTRKNMGWNAQTNPDVRSGGEALTFYATHELWFSVKSKIKKKVRGKDRVIGSVLKIHVKKNRVSGRDRDVLVHFYPQIGFDETGTNIAYLIEEKHWEADVEKGTGKITKVYAPEFDFKGTVEKLAEKIETEGKERELRLLVSNTWDEIEAECEIQRKPRYA